MKTNKLMTKLSLVLLLSGLFDVGMTANTVHAADWGLDIGYGLNKDLNDQNEQSDQTNKQHSVYDSDFDTPYGFHLSGPISDVPMFTPSEVKSFKSTSGENKLSKSEERNYEKLDKWNNTTKIGKFKVTKAVKKYYNACSVKFKKPVEFRNYYIDEVDMVHHNSFWENSTDGYAINGAYLTGDVDLTNQDANIYDNYKDYGLGYKKINGLWMELTVRYSKHKKLYLTPQYSVIEPMPTKAIYKVIKDTNQFDGPDDGTANGFGDKEHQYAQVVYNIDKGTKFHINDDKSNWRATYNDQKLFGGKMHDSTSGRISMINFNKYFKRIK